MRLVKLKLLLRLDRDDFRGGLWGGSLLGEDDLEAAVRAHGVRHRDHGEDDGLFGDAWALALYAHLCPSVADCASEHRSFNLSDPRGLAVDSDSSSGSLVIRPCGMIPSDTAYYRIFFLLEEGLDATEGGMVEPVAAHPCTTEPPVIGVGGPPVIGVGGWSMARMVFDPL